MGGRRGGCRAALRPARRTAPRLEPQLAAAGHRDESVGDHELDDGAATGSFEGVQDQLDEPALRQLLGFEALYLVAGLSRSFKGEYWPLVAGVLTLPDYVAEIDERRL